MDKRLLKLTIGIFLAISLLIMGIAVITADDKILDGGVGLLGVSDGAGAGISNIVEDTSPQLGGNLDGQGFNITDIVIDSSTNTIHADTTYIDSRNVSGSTITGGSPVYASGYNAGQDKIEIDLSDADSSATMPAIGILESDILNNANGHVIASGVFDSLDTTGTPEGESWAVGDTLYVSATLGELTNVKPTGTTELIQAIAKVVRSHATLGRILVQGAGRTNDVPNSILTAAGWTDNDPNVVLTDITDNVGIGTSTTGSTNQLHIVLDGSKDILIDGTTNNRAIDTGVMRFEHTPSIVNTRCITKNIDINSQPSTHADVVNLTATGLAAGETATAYQVNMDASTSTGGVMRGLSISKSGAGSAVGHGIHVDSGLDVLSHFAGTFINVEQAWDENGGFTDVTTAFNSTVTDVTIFNADNDMIHIGMDAAFNEIRVNLDTFAGGAGIFPTFEYSSGGGTPVWTVFTAEDETQGFRQNGLITWVVTDLVTPTWAVATINAVSKMYIRITRTQNTIPTDPIEDTIQVASTNDYEWDATGNLTINSVILEGTSDGFEQTINTIDPTADRAFNFPNDELVAGDILVASDTSDLEYLNLTTTQILIGDGAGVPTAAALSGDTTMTNGGVVTVVDDSHNHVITNIDSFTKANLETQTSDVSDYAEADGDVYTGAHDFGGADSIEIVNGATPTTNATGEIALDTTITDHQPLFQYYDGAENMTAIAIDTAELPATDNEIIKYDAATDKFVLEADAGGVASGWVDDGTVVRLDDATDDVGVGTSTPSVRLEVWDDSGTVGTIKLHGSDHAVANDYVEISHRIFNQNNIGNSVFIGSGAGAADDLTDNRGVFVGIDAGTTNTSGYDNAFVGKDAGRLNDGGDSNTFIGMSAGYSNSAGWSNTFIGKEAGYTNASGLDNTFVGRTSGYNNTGGSNAFFGFEAGYTNTSAGSNTFLGNGAGRQTSTGASNTYVGTNAGKYLANGSTSNATTGTSAFLGMDTKASADGVANETVIGYNTIGKGSNTVILGAEGANTAVYATGGLIVNDEGFDVDSWIEGLNDVNLFYVDAGNDGIGIGTDTASAQLHVNQVDAVDAVRVDDEAGDTSPFIIDDVGNVGIGTAAPLGPLHIVTDSQEAYFDSYSNGAGLKLDLELRRARGTSESPLVVQDGDLIGEIRCRGYNDSASSFEIAAGIVAFIDGEPATSADATDMPGGLEFHTTLDGSAIDFDNPRMVIKNDGLIGISTIAPGSLLSLGTAGTTLGDLSMAGNTSGVVTIQPAAAAGTYTLTLPTNDGDVGQFLQTDGSGTTTWVTGDSRNGLINADFNISQRGTSFAAIAHDAYCLDRFIYQEVGASIHTISQDTDVPTVAESNHLSKYSIKVDCTTIDDSVAAGDYALIAQRIEGYNFLFLAQQEINLSFWHKHTKTGTYCIAVRNSNADRSYVAEYTQTTTNTWEKATINITASPSAGTWDYTTGIGLEVRWAIFTGTTFHGTADTWESANDISTSSQVNAADSTDNNFMLAQVKLEQGSVATRFVGEGIATDLARCKRYYEELNSAGDTNINFANGWALTTTSAQLLVHWLVEKRIIPTTTVSAAADFRVKSLVGGSLEATSVVVFAQGVLNGRIDFDVASGLTAGSGTMLLDDSGGNSRIKVDAEL